MDCGGWHAVLEAGEGIEVEGKIYPKAQLTSEGNMTLGYVDGLATVTSRNGDVILKVEPSNLAVINAPNGKVIHDYEQIACEQGVNTMDHDA